MSPGCRRSTHRTTASSSRSRAAFLVLVALALTLAGCSGGSGDDEASPESTAAASDEPETTTTTEAPAAVAAGEVATGEPVPSAGCGTTTAETAELERNDVGADRYYLLSSPPEPDADEPLPVVLDLHGLIEGAQVHSQNTAFGPTPPRTGSSPFSHTAAASRSSGT